MGQSDTGTTLAVRPTRWKLHVETLPGKRALARRWRKMSTRKMATEPAKPLPQPPVNGAAVVAPSLQAMTRKPRAWLPEDVAFRQFVDIAQLRWRIERDFRRTF
jgi:SRSO17 transposase